MAIKIEKPTKIRSAGNKVKIIEEYIGRVNSKTADISIAHMKSPAGWEEPGQKPEFREYTLVLSGKLHVKTNTQELDVLAGEAVIVDPDEWVQYSTPDMNTEYFAICMPAFSNESVHRDKI
jgi:ethanolamine utilization protein EutQ